MDRRQFLNGMGMCGTSILLSGCGFGGESGAKSTNTTTPAPAPERIYDLEIQKTDFLLRNKMTTGLVSLQQNAPPPVLFANQGEMTRFNLRNSSEAYTAMHWHGIRLANEMDGVPYLTQLPIAQNETFVYDFAPPDAGTYWYHPHCLTMTQMAQGLTGALVIKEKVDPGFDDDHVINLKDFMLDENDQLDTPYSLRNAARAGTFGNFMTANWQQSPRFECKAGGLARIRLVNTDTTRIHQLHFTSSHVKVIAWDGHPIEEEISTPDQNNPLILGPGQRADVVVLMPATEEATVEVIAGDTNIPQVMSTLVATGVNLNRNLQDVVPLPPNPIAQPDMQNSESLDFLFGWSPLGKAPNNGYCGTLGSNFWSINRVAWPGDNAPSNEALATLEQGRTYIMRMQNGSPNTHPIHLHGLVFKPISSNLRKIPANWTDTVVLLKDEIVEVVVVADNPGDWAFHCHVIEHQKTGLAGFITVA